MHRGGLEASGEEASLRHEGFAIDGFGEDEGGTGAHEGVFEFIGELVGEDKDGDVAGFCPSDEFEGVFDAGVHDDKGGGAGGHLGEGGGHIAPDLDIAALGIEGDAHSVAVDSIGVEDTDVEPGASEANHRDLVFDVFGIWGFAVELVGTSGEGGVFPSGAVEGGEDEDGEVWILCFDGADEIDAFKIGELDIADEQIEILHERLHHGLCPCLTKGDRVAFAAKQALHEGKEGGVCVHDKYLHVASASSLRSRSERWGGLGAHAPH